MKDHKMHLIDSNILIYALNSNEKLKIFVDELDENEFAVSAVSRLEVSMGIDKHDVSLWKLRSHLDDFDNLPFTSTIADLAFELDRKTKKKLKFKDLIIAATAKLHNLTLVTADKDFENVPGLKVKLFEL